MITAEKNEIKSDYAEYNRKKGFIKFKNNIVAKDSNNNIIKTNNHELLINKQNGYEATS